MSVHERSMPIPIYKGKRTLSYTCLRCNKQRNTGNIGCCVYTSSMRCTGPLTHTLRVIWYWNKYVLESLAFLRQVSSKLFFFRIIITHVVVCLFCRRSFHVSCVGALCSPPPWRQEWLPSTQYTATSSVVWKGKKNRSFWRRD